ncbi:U3 small nucleolar RNA-associated protein 18 homolog [Thrips palmi]|uniref:U3 small nucleolar RNA-associated protein 18 homolog n=1 Tax=Thrips palmi TaxID=161013 RepID=A0A6P8Y9D6_THRPL|nr:U3 small nucleolar RNA-associated protein 18 homolog [Thrips palmi]
MFRKARKRTRDEGAMGGSSSEMGSGEVGDDGLKKKPRNMVLGLESHLEEQRLEKLIFGNASDVIANLDTDDELEFDESPEPRRSHTDRAKRVNEIIASPSEEDSGVEEGDLSPSTEEDKTREPVWMDDDDDNIPVKQAFQLQGRNLQATSNSQEEYSSFLKRKHDSLMGTPRWAELGKTRKSDSDSEDEDNIMQHSGPFLSHQRPLNLRKGMLESKQLRDLNVDTNVEGPIITATEFHPTSTVALVAGLGGAVSIVQVDGKTNTKLQTVQFERFPIRCAHFSHDGNQFIVGSRDHGHFHVYDMMVGRSIRVPADHSAGITNMQNFTMSPDGRLIAALGRYGHIHLLTAQSKEWVGSLKMNADVKAICFNKDGSRLYSHGDGGEVYIWDMHSRSCIHRFIDDGCITGTSIAVSPSDQYLACGSSSGVVNIYEGTNIFSSASPHPTKVALNLVTKITSLKFNATSEVLAMASIEKDNAIKLMHFPSMTVFSNFPHISKNHMKPQCLDFSPQSGFLSFGNNKGTALLYRLKHYGNY